MKHTTHLLRWMATAMLATIMGLAVIAVIALTVQVMDAQKLQSQCPALVKEWQDLPKHIQIKCKELK